MSGEISAVALCTVVSTSCTETTMTSTDSRAPEGQSSLLANVFSFVSREFESFVANATGNSDTQAC